MPTRVLGRVQIIQTFDGLSERGEEAVCYMSTNKTFRFYLNGNHNYVFNFQLINEETISKTIDDMHTKASCGFDGISSRLLKLIKPVLTKS